MENQNPAVAVSLVFRTIIMIAHQAYHTIIDGFTLMAKRQGKPLLRSCHADFTRTSLQFAHSYLRQLHYNVQ